MKLWLWLTGQVVCPRCGGGPILDFDLVRNERRLYFDSDFSGTLSIICTFCRGKGRVKRKRALTYILTR